jgi:hypothetical protein
MPGMTLSRPSRLLLLLFATAAIVPVVLAPLTPEVASTLAVSRRLLEGAHLYRDIIDYAPPLIFVLGLPIEAAARATGWQESYLVAGALIALCGIALWLMRRILQPEGLAVTTLAGAAAMMLATAARDLGQAEHLVVIMLAPYALWCARLADTDSDDPRVPRAIRIAIGLLACLSVALKPIDLIACAVLLAYVAVSRRRLRILLSAEHLIVAIGVAVYAVAVVIFTPDYARVVLPMAWLQWLHGGDGAWQMVGDWMVWSIGASSLALAILAPWLTRGRGWATLVRACALTSVAMFVTFVVQRDAGSAQFLPVRAFNFLAIWLAAAGFVASMMERRTSRPALLETLALAGRTGVVTAAVVPALLVCSMIAEVHYVDYANTQAGLRSPFVEPLIDLVHQRAAGKPIFVLSSSVGPAFPLVNLSEATWPYRFKSLSFVSIYYKDLDNPATAVYRPPQAQSAAERAFFDEVVGELTRRPPALLIVDVTRLKQGFGLTYFDFLTYYRQSPEFGVLLRHYRLIEWKKNFQVFEYQPSL